MGVIRDSQFPFGVILSEGLASLPHAGSARPSFLFISVRSWKRLKKIHAQFKTVLDVIRELMTHRSRTNGRFDSGEATSSPVRKIVKPPLPCFRNSGTWKCHFDRVCERLEKTRVTLGTNTITSSRTPRKTGFHFIPYSFALILLGARARQGSLPSFNF